MPIYLDGKEYADAGSLEAAYNPNIPEELKRVYIMKADPRTEKQRSDRNEMAGNEMSGDFQSRWGAVETLSTTMPLESTEKLADALKPNEGTLVASEANGSPEPSKSLDWGKGVRKFIAKTAENIVTLPKRAIENSQESLDSGNYDPSAPFDAATLAVLGSFPIARAVGVDGTLGSFAGVRSATMKDRRNDLGGAQTLEAQGKSVDEIHAATGMFRGTDGRWRYEIDDSKLSYDKSWINKPVSKQEEKAWGEFEQRPFVFNEGFVTAKLGEVLDHPELYKAYPDLKNVELVYDPKKKGAHADFRRNEIVVGPDHVANEGTLMHEVQHMIQSREGFAQGGSPMKATSEYQLKYQKDFENLRPEMAKLYDKHMKHVDFGFAPLTAAEKERVSYLDKIAKTYIEYVKAANKQAEEYYNRLAGETESRNVDTRLLLTEKERRVLHPKWTEDVGPRDQILTDKVMGTTAYGLIDDAGKLTKPASALNSGVKVSEIPLAELLKNGDGGMSPFLTAEGKIISTGGDHLSVANPAERLKEGLIRFIYGPDASGKPTLSVEYVKGQKPTKKQKAIIDRLSHKATVYTDTIALD